MCIDRCSLSCCGHYTGGARHNRSIGVGVNGNVEASVELAGGLYRLVVPACTSCGCEEE